MSKTETIVAINSGSSSLKFKLYTSTNPPRPLINGSITGIGSDKALIHISPKGLEISSSENDIESPEKAADFLITWLQKQTADYVIAGIGHRVVQGGLQYSEPEYINDPFLKGLTGLEPLAPLHLPASIAIVRRFWKAFPNVPQIACFDTWFHRQMPFEARHFALPRDLWKKGVIRYGFHGLSCQYILERLEQTDPGIKEKKMIIAHLGSGCSLTAVKEGMSIDTSMSFTPAGGMMMNTRSGDLDPNIVTYLLEKKHMNVSELIHLFNNESGLKAVSATNDAIHQLAEKQKTDEHAEQAIRMFCYQAKKQIGALSAALGGLDIIVFTGGIGEHEPIIREQICNGLEFLGIILDKKLNDRSAFEITAKDSPVSVLVILADEEFIIAKQVIQLLHHQAHYNR